jgi:uncharacterized membrane protein
MPMLAVLGLIIGVLVGAVFGSGAGTVFGGIIGLVVGAAMMGRRKAVKASAASATPMEGALAQRVAQLERRLASLEPRVIELEQAARRGGATIDAPAFAPTPAAPRTKRRTTAHSPRRPRRRRLSRAPSAIVSEPLAGTPASNPVETFDIDTPVQAGAAQTPPEIPPPPRPLAPNPIWAWITGGNPMARIGVVLLFIGVGFLLKYTIEQVYVPISVRLAGVALGGVALLVLGWRLRESRFAYAMALQGGGVGVLYLTVFGALRLYSMIPPVAAFALLLWVSATSSWLAVRQDAIALACTVGRGRLSLRRSSRRATPAVMFCCLPITRCSTPASSASPGSRPGDRSTCWASRSPSSSAHLGRHSLSAEKFATTEPFLVLFFLFYVA